MVEHVNGETVRDDITMNADKFDVVLKRLIDTKRITFKMRSVSQS